MKISLLKPENYIITNWSGGKTTQIAIYPHDAVFSEKDFLWRISSATVENETSSFTLFENYNRYISPLKGTITLNHIGDAKDYILKEYELHSFDGAVETASNGKCVDYNLMLRKNRCYADIQSLFLNEKIVLRADFNPNSGEKLFYVIFCGEGEISAEINGENYMAKAFQTLLIEDFEKIAVNISPFSPAKIIVQKISVKL